MYGPEAWTVRLRRVGKTGAGPGFKERLDVAKWGGPDMRWRMLE